jgi:thiamine biosynthesis lipoprotein
MANEVPTMRMRFFGVLAVLLLSGAEPTLTRYTFTEPHMGTRFRIILYAPDENTAQKAATDAFARIASLNAIMSDYDQASELMRLCAKAGGPPVPVSVELFFVLSKAQEVSRKSDGAFDVTVGPVVKLWRTARKQRKLPDAKKLAEARALVGWQNVRLDKDRGTVQLLKPGMQLDLGGIAKGYAADEALAVLKKHGIDRALVAAGGDIAVSGPPPGADGWKIAIALLPGEKDPGRLILHHAAVSTSGDAEQFVEIDGKRYSHIVDPRTGIGLLGRMSATVVARRGIDADSLTKVIAVLGPEKGIPRIESHQGVSARMVRKKGDEFETIVSKNFPKLHPVEAQGTHLLPPKKIAAIVTVYTRRSHADVIVGKILEGYNYDGFAGPNLQLVSMYVDQTPEKDMSRALAKKHGFTIYRTIADTLTLGGDTLAVEGVLCIGAHGNYPKNAKGQVLYPRRRFFDEVCKVFEKSKKSVPVFSDKHLSATWTATKWMYDRARELSVPLLAGSSIPLVWRRPKLQLPKGCPLTEAVQVGYSLLEAYGFHALEGLQCMAERRQGGETGVKAVQCLQGPSLWEATGIAQRLHGLVEKALWGAKGPAISSTDAVFWRCVKPKKLRRNKAFGVFERDKSPCPVQKPYWLSLSVELSTLGNRRDSSLKLNH